MMKHRKLFALLLAVCMVLALLPSFAAADTEKNDILTADLFTATSTTTYADFSNVTAPSGSGAVYAGNSARYTNTETNKYAIQIRGKNDSGIVTTASNGKVTKVSVDWDSNTVFGRTLNVYGKDTVFNNWDVDPSAMKMVFGKPFSELYREWTEWNAEQCRIMGIRF